ncbi:hypothetical protein EK21DRAFT_53229 [Setomelanomma holmii]|uniref:Uncharacterized protein n=1 Tax=Setomelanomma holmii TaxID=210430 RepID=A0A9P4HJS9_9PLEO|nr:hypothetical protein EK21DRAFT_53229 [Setomelanomma holmii]
MAQRHMCPSVGLLRRSIVSDASSTLRCLSRAISSSARRLEEQSSDAPRPASAPANPNTRRARSATALKQITSLRNRRIEPGGLAKGNFPSGQMASRAPRDDANSVADSEANVGGVAPPRFAKFAGRPTTTHGAAPPEGRMVRAPSTLKITRNATVGSMRGPNLGGRSAGRGGSRGKSGPGGREQGPKKREKKAGSDNATQSNSISDIDPATTLSDGMVHHLLRLQRKEWDRVPYEPKYAPGSFAAQELIHEGRELFRGEVPPVKTWGPLEKRIGVVGMFGAEAHLKVRRVPDGDDAPYGQEDAVVEETQKQIQ